MIFVWRFAVRLLVFCTWRPAVLAWMVLVLGWLAPVRVPKAL
ncbi:MAG: hypothetical protein ACK52I_01870 [Pseudomonadota bacterium]